MEVVGRVEDIRLVALRASENQTYIQLLVESVLSADTKRAKKGAN